MKRVPRRFICWVGVLVLASLQAEISFSQESSNQDARRTTPPSVKESLAAIKTQPGIRVELAASEPNVVDPVAVRFDHRGRMWVVEMRDYPTGPIGDASPDGRIRVLIDGDQDGFFETSHTFADGLMFPTGLQLWNDGGKDGVIVTLAGKIEYFADRNGDLRSDHREVWFQGFAEDNEQLRANHPTLGPDGRVYVANGLRGGKVKAVHSKFDPKSEPLDLFGRDFVFDPNGSFYGTVIGNSQFGFSIDDFGNRVGCSNRNPAFESIFHRNDLSRSRWMGSKDGIQDLSLAGGDSTVVAIAESWTTSHTHSGQFSAACGVTVGLGPNLPDQWRNGLVACEPTSYAVQRQVIDSPDNERVGRIARRVSGKQEFVASRDTWFRPVDTEVGPDGSLYVVDMCRAVIEHPQWVPKELRKREDERWGNGQGRIWRIVSEDQPNRRLDSQHQNFDSANRLSDWISRLADPNPAMRALATQHLMSADKDEVSLRLIDRFDRKAFDEIKDFELARILGLLAGFQRLKSIHLYHATEHPSPRLRRTAIRLARESPEIFRHGVDEREWIAKLIADENAWVRFDAIGLASDWVAGIRQQVNGNANSDLSSHVDQLADQIAMQVLTQSCDKPWLDRYTCLEPSLASATLVSLMASGSDDLQEPNQLEVFYRLSFQAWKENQIEQPSLIRVLSESPSDVAKFAFLAGCMDAGWRKGDSKTSDAIVQQARRIAVDTQSGERLRLWALTVIAQLDAAAHTTYEQLLDDDSSDLVQRRCIEWMLSNQREPMLDWLGMHLSELPASVRESVLNRLVGDPRSASIVLDWIDDRVLFRTLISIKQSDRLLKSKSSSVAERAGQLFKAARADRLSVIADYKESLLGHADLKKGQVLFTQQCATCHQVGSVGKQVGPDISDSRSKSRESLLTAILDPSSAIDAAFLQYQALLDDGTIQAGLLMSRSGEQVIFQEADEKKVIIPTDSIEKLQLSDKSMMPEGFEGQLNPDQMRDLIGYLKGWRYLDSGTKTLDLESLD